MCSVCVSSRCVVCSSVYGLRCSQFTRIKVFRFNRVLMSQVLSKLTSHLDFTNTMQWIENMKYNFDMWGPVWCHVLSHSICGYFGTIWARRGDKTHISGATSPNFRTKFAYTKLIQSHLFLAQQYTTKGTLSMTSSFSVQRKSWSR